MQVRLRFEFGTGNPLRRSRASKARNAGEITFFVCLEGCARLGFVVQHAGKIFPFLRMSRVKRSLWKSIFSFFANVSCETLVLEVYVRFGSLHSHFLRMSRAKRSFWKSILSLFANVSRETLVLEVYVHSHFLRMSRVKRSFWKSTFSLFANVSCLRMSRVKRSFSKSILSLFANFSRETLVLEVYIVTFCECLA